MSQQEAFNLFARTGRPTGTKYDVYFVFSTQPVFPAHVQAQVPVQVRELPRQSVPPNRFANQEFIPGSGAVKRPGYDSTVMPRDVKDEEDDDEEM